MWHDQCEWCGRHETRRERFQSWRRRVRARRQQWERDKALARPTDKCTALLEKYEALAADRQVWIDRAHGREEGWPLQ